MSPRPTRRGPGHDNYLSSANHIQAIRHIIPLFFAKNRCPMSPTSGQGFAEIAREFP
jgi:hypothetical protein